MPIQIRTKANRLQNAKVEPVLSTTDFRLRYDDLFCLVLK